MTINLIDAQHWAILFGTFTLTCWIAAGLAAVLGTADEIRHGHSGKVSGYVTTGLTGAGIGSALVMIAMLVFA